MNTKQLGTLQKEYIAFLTKYPGWTSYSPFDFSEKRAVDRLIERGLVERNDFGQIRLVKEHNQ